MFITILLLLKKGRDMLKNRKIKISIFSFLSIVLVLIISSGLEMSSFASNSSQRRNKMMRGIERIDKETLTLEQARIKRYEKLENDLKEFREKGSENISENSYLYLTNKTDFSAEELEAGLKNTELLGLGKDFKNAEDKYGVNAILLMAMAKHETGNGDSYLAKEKNNLFGFNAIDQDPINKANHFKNKGESINHVAKFLKENYLSKDGKFYNGISTSSIGKLYASDPYWSEKVDYMMREVSVNILENK